MDNPQAPRVIIVDENKRYRETMAEILSASGIDVIGAVAENAMFPMLEEKQPDVVIYDFFFSSNMFSIIIKRIKAISPASKVLVTGFEDDVAELCVLNGADGFFSKTISDIHLVTDAIKRVASGEKVVLTPQNNG